MLDMQQPITQIKGVGPELAKKFGILGIATIADLAYYFPRRYEDYSTVSAIWRIPAFVIRYYVFRIRFFCYTTWR